MGIGRVQARGQITVPRDIRRAAQIEPGDAVTFRVAGPGKLEVTVLPRMRLAEALERYRITDPVDDDAIADDWKEAAATAVLGQDDV